jgi:dimethylhistidine N-methyltransferase
MNTEFAQSVNEGLSRKHKNIPSRYFYNAQGDALFQQIMELPGYYPTKCEYEIFDRQKSDILKSINQPGGFNLVELGAGDGYKTKLLLKHFLEAEANFKYFPIDISGDVLKELKAKLNQEMPQLNVQTFNHEYFRAVEEINKLNDKPKVLLFLGGNIGNFTTKIARSFFSRLEAIMQPGDKLLCGIDLKKNPRIILNAYDDDSGITAKFNLNVLQRINEELGANFNLENFVHYPNYNPVNGECRSYLISQKKQKVHIGALDKSFSFEAAEAIHTEISKKYSLKDIERLATKTGFKVQHNFTDTKQYFVDSLWQKR